MVISSSDSGKDVRDLRHEDRDKATAKGEFVGALVSVLCLYFVMYKTMSFVCCVYVFCYVCLCVGMYV